MVGNRAIRIALATALLAGSASLLGGAKSQKKELPAQLSEQERIVHALNRFTFGARPGDIEKVRKMGLEKWFELQLHPEKIDDSALQARLEPFQTLKMDSRAMLETFPPPPVLKAVSDGRLPMPSAPEKRAIYRSALEMYRLRQQNKQDEGAEKAGAQAVNDMAPDEEAARERRGRRELHQQASAQMQKLQSLSPEQRYQALLQMDAGQRNDLVRGLNPEERESLQQGLDGHQREMLLALVRPQAVIGGELMQAKLLREIYSERQLEEVMTDFWLNHFNVFIGKGADRYLLTSYERDAIRPHALGKFKDLLLATATHPAMLFYLDNFQSVGPDSEFARFGGRGNSRRAGTASRRRGFGLFEGGGRRRGRRDAEGRDGDQPITQNATQARQQRRPVGLNENYARELMELHTLGVDGGYTQKDVTEVAKVFTGWTVRQPRLGGEFEFNPHMHEPGSKTVLGQTIEEGGQGEGKKVLDMLAHSPATAKFISRKLAMRFVSDDPPQSLVDRMAETFLKKDGDIREVLRTMFHSPEFWSKDAYRAKVKTPLEFVVSAARVTGADVKNAAPLIQSLQRMGLPLYGSQPPTGYSMKADAWVNSSALLNRMNFALALGIGRLRGVQVDVASVFPPGSRPEDGDAALTRLADVLLAGNVSKNTRESIMKRLGDPQVTRSVLDDPDRGPNIGVLAGLLLGSPEFQRR
jgi:uncharacterized protein (DUF1800 family)